MALTRRVDLFKGRTHRVIASGARAPTVAGASDRSDGSKSQHKEVATDPHEQRALTWHSLTGAQGRRAGCPAPAERQRQHEELLRTGTVH